MSAKLLIIEHGSTPQESSCQSVLNSHIRCERQTWDGLRPESLVHTQAQLILAHAAPETPRALGFFRWLHEHPVRIPALAILPESPSDNLMELVSTVADDFLVGPVRGKELSLRIDRLLQYKDQSQQQERPMPGQTLGAARIIGNHPSILQATRQVTQFAADDAPVLITGETGTGKELFAHAIHSLSKRNTGPFIPLDCGSLPEEQAETELFGCVRGASSDTLVDQTGMVAIAEGGTLFLDEVDTLSSACQAKLMRFLQEGVYRAIGADRATRANVRLMAASNRRLEDCVQQGRFRSDLYFRLNVLRLQLPPLRERNGDISLLANHFLETECPSGNGERKIFSPAALRVLESHAWPGNARELFNAVRQAVVCSRGRQIMPEDILLSVEPARPASENTNSSFRSAKQHAIEEFEKAYVKTLMARHRGNITQAARAAGKERRAFGRLVKKYRMSAQGA